ncbi:MAG: hypothetical protein PHY76_00745 [Patescibacteria group bacterium]|jgi:hypothetical protein|nr:hypothetical protein [Patescibacteria group bacterium]
MSKLLIKSLDTIVNEALDFFSNNPPAKINLANYKFPLVVGSGNAFNTGKILFAKKAAVFANESNFKKTLKDYEHLIKNGTIREAFIISASGEKDSIWEAKKAKAAGLKTILLTCALDSSAAQITNEVKGYRKLAEPYTYNFSTYCGMILSVSGEKIKNIKEVLKKLKTPANFSTYKSYSFILPDEFGELAPMLDIKRHELFGPKLSLRAFTFGEARHAKFVVRDPKELVISFGANKFFGSPNSRWEINLPKNIGYAGMMALTYFLVGQIQNNQPDYFRKNIERFCKDDGPKAYGSNKPFSVIVPGN